MISRETDVTQSRKMYVQRGSKSFKVVCGTVHGRYFAHLGFVEEAAGANADGV